MTSTDDLPLDQFIDLGDRRLRVRRFAPGKGDGFERTTLVFLHEGLGCIEMWRDFPQALCDATRCAGIVYDRTGYGGSSRWPRDPGVRYMEIEAANLMRFKACALFDAHQPCGAEANMAKLLAADASWEAGNACLQFHGGFGFASEYDVERKFRETRLLTVAPVSNNLVLAYLGQHVLGMPKSY